MELTKFQALTAEIEPYVPSKLSMMKALSDVGVSDTETPYDPTTDKRIVAQAAVKVLSQMVMLSSDSLGKSSQGYNVDMLRKRIKAICSENGLDLENFDEVPTITDGSNLW